MEEKIAGLIKVHLEEKDRQLTVALKGKRPFETKLADEVIARQVRRIQELEEKLNGWFAERDALKKELDEARTEAIGFGNALTKIARFLDTPKGLQAAYDMRHIAWTALKEAE